MNAFDYIHTRGIIPSQADSRISSYTVYIVPTYSAIVNTCAFFVSGTEKYLSYTAATTLTDDTNNATRTGEFSKSFTN